MSEKVNLTIQMNRNILKIQTFYGSGQKCQADVAHNVFISSYIYVLFIKERSKVCVSILNSELMT